jgi:hypothetical protein
MLQISYSNECIWRLGLLTERKNNGTANNLIQLFNAQIKLLIDLYSINNRLLKYQYYCM